MPKLVKNKARGVLQNGFFATVDDYPIAGGWGLNGKLFAVQQGASKFLEIGTGLGDTCQYCILEVATRERAHLLDSDP